MPVGFDQDLGAEISQPGSLSNSCTRQGVSEIRHPAVSSHIGCAGKAGAFG